MTNDQCWHNFSQDDGPHTVFPVSTNINAGYEFLQMLGPTESIEGSLIGVGRVCEDHYNDYNNNQFYYLTTNVSDPGIEPLFLFRCEQYGADRESLDYDFYFITDGEKYAFLITPYGELGRYDPSRTIEKMQITECEFCVFNVHTQKIILDHINKLNMEVNDEDNLLG
jgi:hypothetical protein